MRHLLALLFTVGAMSAQSHKFTHDQKRRFENAALNLARGTYLVEHKNHPNPKLYRLRSKWQQAGVIAVGSVPGLVWAPITELIENSGARWPMNSWHRFRNRAFCDFQWSDDGRSLRIVSSQWGGEFFDREADGETLKESTFSVFIISNIVADPKSFEIEKTARVTDYPAVYRGTTTTGPFGGFAEWYNVPFHDGGFELNWDLQVDYNDFSPVFYGWFQWHHKNHMLALLERFDTPYFDAPREWTRTDYAWDIPPLPGVNEHLLTVRNTRREVVDRVTLTAGIEGSIAIASYVNLKRWNTGTLSYRTSTYRLKDTNHHWGSVADLMADKPYWPGTIAAKAEADKALDYKFTQTFDIHRGTEYSGTRYRPSHR